MNAGNHNQTTLDQMTTLLIPIENTHKNVPEWKDNGLNKDKPRQQGGRKNMCRIDH